MSSILLLIPFYFNRAMIIGSDTIFHFNRFYDTAMQIKHGNFQYFISMYGFQESGRIVNALYGPVMSYVQGALVLISPSWFGYQIISNSCLYFLASLSLYLLLRKAHIAIIYRLPLSLFYLTTYAIQYWTLRQGFSSWGAALFPICLIPLIDLVEKKSLDPIKTALAIALMCQVHMLSALLLILVYACFYILSVFNTTKVLRIQLLKQAALSVVVFIPLVLNVFYSFVIIYLKNNIAQPFVNPVMANTTIFKGSSYWLFSPILLLMVIAFVVLKTFYYWHHKGFDLLSVTATSCGLLFLLCTDIFPWKILNSTHIKLVEVIQFPFRFFVPFIVLLLLTLGIILQHSQSKSLRFGLLSYGILLLSLFQVILSNNAALNQWHNKRDYLNSNVHTYFVSDDAQKVKKSFFIKDKSTALKNIVKATPDYLPVKSGKVTGKYDMYHHQVLKKQTHFKKSIFKNKLLVEWQGDRERYIQIPVVKYTNTILFLNQKSVRHNQIILSKIGAVSIKQVKGNNRLLVYYRNDNLLILILLITFISWLTALGYIFKYH